MKFAWRLCGGLLLAISAIAAAHAGDELADARALLLTGKYAEAEESYGKLRQQQPVAAALGIARALEAVGALGKANESLSAAAKENPKAAELPAELARLAIERTDYPAAQQFVSAALAIEPDQLLARWVQAELLRTGGRLDEADKAYKWFVSYYNDREKIDDSDAIRLIGLAAAQYARWNRLSQQFTFLVNDLFPEALQLDKNYWPAHYETGLLFLEKYNQADATKELQAALALNPQAAEVHVATGVLALQGYELAQAQTAAERALEINPQLISARELQADIHLANLEAAKAIEVLEAALKQAPHREETLGRLAAAYGVVEGLDKPPADTRWGKIIDGASRGNPHAGVFFLAFSDSLDLVQRYPAAARYYQQAIDVMPQLTTARGRLGLMLMRLGDEERAKKILDEAFEVDPFNVRVSNTLKVLEVLSGYETLETEHFLIRHDPKDKLMARYAARWLEEVYPVLCKQFAFEPPQKSLFEIFSAAKKTDAHGWFSARMVGLPHIHTIGACAGKMVAMESPTAGERKFNWARVLKHEFVHVINLQQTHFNIPHWYTEGLAVLNEGHPRPPEWDDLLADRVPKNKLFNLDTINLGFIRAHSSAEWNLAYCQAELYARYMLKTYGEDSLAKMLSAYADNLTTAEALKRSFKVEQAEFEKGYSQYLQEIVGGLRVSTGKEPATLDQLQKQLAAEPANTGLMGQLAQARFSRKQYPEARRLADAALKIEAKQPLANYVRARLHLLVGEDEQALALLQTSLDSNAPQSDHLGLLATLKLKGGDLAEAARLYELGAKHEPSNKKWNKSLAAVYLKSGDKQKLAAVLEQLAVADGDDLPMRKKLAELALDVKDYPRAARFAKEALQIDVQDAQVHQMLGAALSGQDQPVPAIDELETAIELKPDAPRWQLDLAKAYVQAKQPEKARAILEALRKQDFKDPGVDELLRQLGQ